MDEYLLPHPEIPAGVLTTLHPWMQAVATSSMDQIRNMLEERLRNMEQPPLSTIRETVLSYQPVSLLIEANRTRLRLTSPDPASGIANFYLPPPSEDESIQGLNPWIFLIGIDPILFEGIRLLNLQVPDCGDQPATRPPEETEYPFPHPQIPAEALDVLHPWLRSVAGADLSQLRLMLEERFADVVEPELRLLRDQLLSYQPISIVTFRESEFLKLAGPLEYSVAYLPPPVDTSQIQSRLREIRITDPLFRSFMNHFAGLAESADTAGNFAGNSDHYYTMTEDWQREALPDFQAWEGSLMFYHARNGDQILLHPDGKVGWWKFAEHRIVHAYDSFADFLRFYVDFRARTDWPLDSYGPDEE